MPNLPRQRGFALVSVLMVVAFAALMLTELLTQERHSAQRSAFFTQQAQVLAVIWGAEEWVESGLEQAGAVEKITHLNQFWAQPLPPVDFEGASVAGQLIDLNRYINLNNLLATNPTQIQAWRKVVARLSGKAGLSPDFAWVIRDWIDVDSDVNPAGAEDEYYLLQEPAYRTANHPLVALEEIQWMKDWDGKAWSFFSQNATAAPGLVKINVNTASSDTLALLSDLWTPAALEAVMSQRQETPFESTAAFRTFIMPLLSLDETQLNQDFNDEMITVKSDHFLLQARVEMDTYGTYAFGLFRRDEQNQVSLLQRYLLPLAQGPQETPPTAPEADGPNP